MPCTARVVRNPKISTRSARARLPQRREPYWTTVSKGCAVGYRKGTKGGRWIARWRDDEGKQHYEAIGPADDALDAESPAALSFEQAQERARAWFARKAREAVGDVQSGPYTVADCIRDYVEDLRRRGSTTAQDTETRARALILPELGEVSVDKLTAKRIRTWHQRLAEAPARLRTRKGEAQQYRDAPSDDEEKRRRRATANRMLTILKAALNRAYAEGKVATDDAWRRVKPFRAADAPRIDYLSDDELRRLINAADEELRPLVLGAVLTGCRYEELARMRCADFDGEAGTVLVRRAKSGKARQVVLNDEGAEFFEAHTAGRPDDAVIFTHADGRPWGKSHQARPLERAVHRAGISRRVNFHTLRHTYASHLARQGVPMAVIAANLGHADTRMTEPALRPPGAFVRRRNHPQGHAAPGARRAQQPGGP